MEHTPQHLPNLGRSKDVCCLLAMEHTPQHLPNFGRSKDVCCLLAMEHTPQHLPNFGRSKDICCPLAMEHTPQHLPNFGSTKSTLYKILIWRRLDLVSAIVRWHSIKNFGSVDTVLCACFVWISEQTSIFSVQSINWLVFMTDTECVYCAVRVEFLCTVQVNVTI
jgi:hypothetical protein